MCIIIINNRNYRNYNWRKHHENKLIKKRINRINITVSWIVYNHSDILYTRSPKWFHFLGEWQEYKYRTSFSFKRNRWFNEKYHYHRAKHKIKNYNEIKEEYLFI